MDKQTAWKALSEALAEVHDLEAAGAVLGWDQTTYMPPGGALARGRQLATLGRLAHEKSVDPRIGDYLETLRPWEEDAAAEQAPLLRLVRRQYERARRVPPAFSAAVARHSAAAYDAWVQARPRADFAAVRPHLEHGLALSREYAGFFPEAEHVADPLIAAADHGFTAARIRPLFARLRQDLVSLLRRIAAADQVDDACLHQKLPGDRQIQLATDIAGDFGYDFERGRCDRTHHPFATAFSIGDVRITTRADDNHLEDGVFATLHEAGHGLYEQGIDPRWEGTPLASGTSSAVHESQSRLWENTVGRSLELWRHYFPRLQEAFPGSFDGVAVEAFYRAINKVQPSLIRVQADEVTYGLHIMIRFELELELLEGRLDVADLPVAWDERYAEYLGIQAPDASDGVLQDVHWYAGLIGGAFHSYLLGNVMGAQFYAAALKQHPEIPQETAAGRFGTLHGWLKEGIYCHGAGVDGDALVQRLSGQALDVQPYIAALEQKFAAIYRL